MEAFHLTIDGQIRPGSMTMEVIDPATGKLLADCPRADAECLDNCPISETDLVNMGRENAAKLFDLRTAARELL